MDFDFTDYIVIYDRKYNSGHTFSKGAFKPTRTPFVPIVFSTNHDLRDGFVRPDSCVGHAVLDYLDNGVVAHCKFSDTEIGQMAKTLVVDDGTYDISFFAHRVIKKNDIVEHGLITGVILCVKDGCPRLT